MSKEEPKKKTNQKPGSDTKNKKKSVLIAKGHDREYDSVKGVKVEQQGRKGREGEEGMQNGNDDHSCYRPKKSMSLCGFWICR